MTARTPEVRAHIREIEWLDQDGSEFQQDGETFMRVTFYVPLDSQWTAGPYLIRQAP